MWEWMECGWSFPSQPFVVLTVDKFVGHDGSLLEQQKHDSHVNRKTGTLPLIFRKNQSRHYINEEVWETVKKVRNSWRVMDASVKVCIKTRRHKPLPSINNLMSRKAEEELEISHLYLRAGWKEFTAVINRVSYSLVEEVAKRLA